MTFSSTDLAVASSAPTADDLARFNAKWVEVDGCWVWTAYRTASGYGRFLWKNGTYAHRWAYEHFVGPIPAGLVIDHLCRNRSCVNPAHLEAVTQRENCRRGEPAKRTHCPNGHEYTPENTYLNFRGDGWVSRTCKACSQERGRTRIRDRRAA